jgi:hypothetical protein
MSENSLTKNKTTGTISPEELITLKEEFMSSIVKVLENNPDSLPDFDYLKNMQSYLYNTKYSNKYQVVHTEDIDSDCRLFITKNTQGKRQTWCLFGDECPYQKPTFDENGMTIDGSCTLFHPRSHIGTICSDGMDCPLIDCRTKSSNENQSHYCGYSHVFGISVSGSNQSTHRDHYLESKTLLGHLCTQHHRPGREGKPLDHEQHESCGGSHIVKQDINGNEVIANFGDKDSYLKVSGFEIDKNTGLKKYMDLSYPNNPDKRLLNILTTKPYVPNHMCSRLWYDCCPEYRSKEEDCHHYIMPNIIHKYYTKGKRFRNLKIQTRLRMITQSENSDIKKHPRLINHDRLINYVKTEERRIENNNTLEPYVGNDSYGGRINPYDIKDGSISVFFATGTNLYNERE